MNDKLHREEKDEMGISLPAVIYSTGTKAWYSNNKLHRVEIDNQGNDLPALDFFNGVQIWFCNGEIHRDFKDLPAVICPVIHKKWYHRGQLHRSTVDKNGQFLPAVIHPNASEERWIGGIKQ